MGDSPVVCHAIAHILESGGHQTLILDAAREAEAALPGVALVLVAGAGAGDQTAASPTTDVPVLRLVDTPSQKEALGEKAILWPCSSRELQTTVSAALASPKASSVG